MGRIVFKLDIRSAKDAEGARKLFNYCIYKGYKWQAKDIAEKLCSLGYVGWDKKVALLNRELRR